MLQTHQKAPDFTSIDQNNNHVSLSDYAGDKNVVLYFYPKDDTPGCTIEAKGFTNRTAEFAASNSVIIGVSKDDCDSHRSFIDKYGLMVELLADIDGSLCETYGVWQEKEKNGVKKMGIVRSTFVIDKQGMLAHAEYGVDPNGHEDAILKIVEAL